MQDDHFTVILHNCGNTGHCTKAMVATGAAAYHFGNKIDMVEALKEVPADALAMGNLDPVSLFKAATPEVMKKAALDLLGLPSPIPTSCSPADVIHRLIHLLKILMHSLPH